MPNIEFEIQQTSQQIEMEITIPGASATLEQTEDGLTIIVKDKTGTRTGHLRNGKDGVTAYEDLTGKPSINGETLTGDKTGAQLGLASISDLAAYEPADEAELAHQQINASILQIIQDLGDYYTKNQVDQKISAIPKFTIEVVNTLPTQDISDTTVYLVLADQAETGDLYTEYIHVNGAWEQLGTQSVDLSNYYTKAETDTAIEDSIPTTNGNKKIASITRNASGNAVRVLITDEDGAQYLITGLPSGNTNGDVLRSTGTAGAAAEWESVDTTPTENSSRLVTSGAVFAAINAAINDALAAEY